MEIRSQEDWWKSARATIPLLPEYAASQNRAWDEISAATLLEARDHVGLHSMFEDLWFRLPDSPSIHHYPFGQLCDLCSEYWPFEEEE